MDKKEIIIDGVNVSRCKHYDIDNNYCDQSYLGEGGLLKNTKNPKKCEQSPNCYFKQFKRLEQENIKLLFDKGALIEFCNKLTKIIDEKKENENKILQILSEIKQLVSTGYIKTKKQLVQNYDCLDNFMQKIEDKCNEVNQ